MYCVICGDEYTNLTEPVRYWSPDDGWRTGRFCYACYEDCGKARPQADDYAYAKRDDDLDLDEYIDVVYG